RAMDKNEFDGLMYGNALPQGRSYQGFSPTREYSEAYITGNAKKPTSHLVEFYRPSPTRPDGSEIPELDKLLKAAGAGEKGEDGIMSTAVGDAATYPPEVLENTRKKAKRTAAVDELNEAIAQAEADLADPKKQKFHKSRQKTLAAKKAELDKITARPEPYPAKGDAVKALNQALASGEVAWRLITFRSTV
ncbi:DUF4157 domain-containing protein, partial [Streptomyces sp. 7R007]